MWTKSYGPNYTKFWGILIFFFFFFFFTKKPLKKKKKKKKNICDKVWRYFGRRFCSGNNQLSNARLLGPYIQTMFNNADLRLNRTYKRRLK